MPTTNWPDFIAAGAAIAILVGSLLMLFTGILASQRKP